MSTIETEFQSLMELDRMWTDQVATVNVDKKVADELLQVASE